MENNIIVSEDRATRIEKLSFVKETLKKEYIGLDKIIDEIIESISAWYITPEIIVRPIIVSLWGMTGTGKSSVVRRLIELLGLGNQSMTFDCGECTSDNKNIAENICDTLGLDKEDFNGKVSEKNKKKKVGQVFVFDEFQYARTLNESGQEEVKSSLRPIWSLMDSGILDLTDSYSWGFNQLMSFIEDLESFVPENSNILIKGNQVMDPEGVKAILNGIGFMHYSRNIPGINATGSYSDADEDPWKPLTFIDDEKMRVIIRRLNCTVPGKGMEFAKEIMSGEFKLGEIYEKLREIKSLLTRPKSIDCKNSLIFIIGNLDEAFMVGGDINPDVDADMFYDITSKVTITDIKSALKKRFRPEQIARLGNNLIKYPTLNKESFEKIIDLEINRILKDFNEVEPDISITISDKMKSLLYSEGVYPVQGVRPIFTTISTILTPYLSKILVEKGENEIKEVTIDVEGDGNFKKESVTVIVKFPELGKENKYTHNLQLGEIRKPENRKKRYICSVHEAGHAVVFAYRTGKSPRNIVSVSTDNGGFCTTYDPEYDKEISSRRDVDDDVMISMAGYLSEHVIYKDRLDLCLMGSSSDIQELWENFERNVMEVGYFEPIPFANFQTQSTIDGSMSGVSVSEWKIKYFDGKKFQEGGNKRSIEESMAKRLDDLKKETTEILEKEKTLIVHLALYLGEKGSMTGETFMEYVREYGNELTPEFMDTVREKNNPVYYLNRLLENEN